MDLTFREHHLAEGRALVVVGGRIGAGGAAVMRSRLEALIARGHPRVVCDLSGVTGADSSGLAALVAGLRATRGAGGFLRLMAVPPTVTALLKLTSLDRVFEAYPSVAAAFAEGAARLDGSPRTMASVEGSATVGEAA